MKKTDMEMMSEKTEFGPGKTPLYYNNRGLFSDPFLEERLPNLEEYYNSPSTRFLNDYWNIDESDSTKFNRAFQDIMDLWDKLGQDVEKFCANERQLQNRWIDKIFEYLGWTIELEETVSRHGKTNFPDYGLYKNFDDLAKSKDCKNTFKKALAVADAKAWGINLDGKGFSNKNPSFQIINYLKQTDKTWGVLTDGQYWRIYSVRSESKHTTFYEIDLIKILSTGDYERFKYFYNFFRVEAFEPLAKLNDRCFLDFVFEDGKHYAQRVDQNLNDKVYGVVDSICHGFLVNYKDPSEEELKEVYEYSMYYLFKLMFVLNCESKGLLEVNKQDDYYESSLRKKCMEIKDQFENGKKWSQQPRTYNYINDLFELLKHGDESIGVHGFGEEPFQIGSTEFYEGNKITDEQLNHALLDLACDYDDEDNLQFIDYKVLSPDHIGSLFEGLLEFNLVKKGRKVELLNTKGDRKSTGSYYTPEYLVDYIVKETLEPLTKGKSPKELLELRVLDPSMGSGHFLLGVVKYLEEKIISLQDTDKKLSGAIDFDLIKKNVLHNCVYGVDINPLAAQLAKFSLWIYTSQKGDSLEPLSDQLINQNSLLDEFDWEKKFLGKIKLGELDAVVGNPPYIGEKGNKEIFQLVKDNSLGERFYHGKMDYLYFFIHLGLDLLRKHGRMGYITTNYFPTAYGSKLLRSDLKERARFVKTINFGNYKIFKSAQGQHNLVSFIEKSSKDLVSKNYQCNGKGRMDKDLFDKILNKKNTETVYDEVKNSDLYDGELNYIRFCSGGKEEKELDSVFSKMVEPDISLGDVLNVNTGLFTAADKIYVMKKSEVAKNIGSLNSQEKKIMVPLFKNSDISKFSSNETSDKVVIYHHEKQSYSKKDVPNVIKYLSKHREKLAGRKDNSLKGALKRGRWDVISLAKVAIDFEGEKIVAPQRSKTNTFGYNNSKWYASADVYFITNKKGQSENLKYHLGLLNSKLYYVWLYFKGKRKGESLELYQNPLSEIPLPKANEKQVKSIEVKVNQLIKNYNEKVFNDLSKEVYELFSLTPKEIEQVESFYNSKHSSVEGLDIAA